MKAVNLQGPGKVAIEEREMPKRREGQALLKIRSVSLCGSDVGAYRGTNPMVRYPVVLGHELAGEILEIDSSNPKGLKAGDMVVVEPYVYCGECYPCKRGRTNCCEHLNTLGVHIDGGMAEYFCHPHGLLHKAPDNIPLELLPLAEPLNISLHALNRMGLQAGEFIAIIGAGPIGLLAAQAAVSKGAKPILVDVLDDRLAHAKKWGVPYTVNVTNSDGIEEIREITGGSMCACVVEASGATSAVINAFNYASFSGRVALTGWPKEKIALDTGMFTRKELDVLGARNARPGEMQEALELISSGAVDVRSVLTKTVKLEELADALVDLSERPAEYLKISALA